MRIKTIFVGTTLIVAMEIVPGFPVMAADAPEVTVRNYVRAETDLQMRNYIESMDAFGKFAHVREATDVTSRDTIRPNRDTLYSWSVTVYDDKGMLIVNEYDAYSYNSVTAKRNEDGSVTIHFGGDPGQDNFLPIVPGWNYIVRMYQPRKEILEGTWKFPVPAPVTP